VNQILNFYTVQDNSLSVLGCYWLHNRKGIWPV